MAKKDKEAAQPLNMLEAITSQVQKKYASEGIVKYASSILDQKQTIISFSPNVDAMMSGGVPLGSFLSVVGPPKGGKTTTLLGAAADAQSKDCTVLYIDAEVRLKKMNLTGIKGLDLDPNKFLVVSSDKDKVMSAQDLLDIAETYLKSIPRLFCIIDSVSALVDKRVYEGGMGTETRGSGAKVFSQFIDLVKDSVRINDSIVACIVQTYKNTGGGMATNIEKSSSHLLYQNDAKIRLTHTDRWEVRDKQVGQILHWECMVSALGPPAGKCDSYLRYGMGIDKVYELYEMGKAIGLIETGGAWRTLAYLGVDPPEKCQGDENTYQAIAENPEWLSLLQTKVGEFLNGKPS